MSGKIYTQIGNFQFTDLKWKKKKNNNKFQNSKDKEHTKKHINAFNLEYLNQSIRTTSCSKTASQWGLWEGKKNWIKQKQLVCIYHKLFNWHFYKSTTSLLFIAYAKQADAKSINCELTSLFN